MTVTTYEDWDEVQRLAAETDQMICGGYLPNEDPEDKTPRRPFYFLAPRHTLPAQVLDAIWEVRGETPHPYQRELAFAALASDQ